MLDGFDKQAIGVVIPGYGHPQFLGEAVVSACEQQLDRPHMVVVVDDGCKFPETGQMVAHLMEKYPGVLHYLRQENTRLPGARNAGIRFLMALDPNLDSVYFLDADNRLAPYSLRAFREVLGDDPGIGWAYPDISMFGLSGSEDGFDTRETAPEYSKLKHLVGNISEAGSLVRADLFRNGVFYNEAMTSGFEDWDFWLGALEAGYVGRRARHSGFLYRRRPESMLAESRRLEETLIARIRETHRALFLPKNILKLEQEEAPVFAIHITDSDDILLTSDVKSRPQHLSVDDFKQLLHQWAHGPREFFFPEYMISISDSEWKRFQKAPGHFRWWLWKLREAAHDVAAVALTFGDSFDVDTAPKGLAFCEQPTSFLCIKTCLLKTALLESLEKGVKAKSGLLSDPVQVQFTAPKIPQAEGVPQSAAEQIKYLGHFSQTLLPLKPVSRHLTRRYAGPSGLDIRRDLISEICAVTDREAFPVNTGSPRAMVLASATQLGSERASERFADFLKRLKALEFEALVILEVEPGQSFDETDLNWWGLADDVVPMQLSGGGLEYRLYLGRRVPQRLDLLAKEDLTVLARTCDVILSCGTAIAGLEALGQAKRHGARGFVWLDPAFMTTDRSEMGGEAPLLAYEHAITAVITDDAAYVHGLSAEGFPPSKFQTTTDFWEGLK